MKTPSAPKLTWAFALVAVIAANLTCAADETAPGRINKTGDPKLYEGLREIINRGAYLYNHGDANGCYRLFQGALLALRPQFSARTDLLRTIDSGLTEAERRLEVHERALALRRTLDSVLKEIRPAAAKVTEQRPANQGTSVGSTTSPTLWERLGGESNVKRIIDDFVALAGNDPAVNFTRGGKYRLDDASMARLKHGLVSFLSEATGGPYRYSGRGMKEVHLGMGISDAEFNASALDLRKALERNSIKTAEIEAVLRSVETTRQSIVESQGRGK
jgi:hemoglobin